MPAAIPGVSSSTPPAESRAGGRPLLRLVSPDELNRQDQQRADVEAEARQRAPIPNTDLGAYIRHRWMVFRNHRNQGNNPLNYRLLRAQRMFEGKYDPTKLAEIKAFGGSEVYSRLVAVKCRGANSLLRDVYLGAERPWDIDPQADPPVPPEVRANIAQMIAGEVGNLQVAGQPVLQEQVHARFQSLMHAAEEAARRNAKLQARMAADKMEDILREGGFYRALGEFLVDLTLYPFACIKGPTVRMVPQIVWQNGRPMKLNRPRMCWDRVDPFNLYFSPGVVAIEDAEIIERKRLTRADLNALLGLPGYDEDAVRQALQDYDRGLRDWLDYPDTEQALNEGRENPYLNLTHMIDAVEYHGNIQGQMLLDNGMDPRMVPDPDRDYKIQSWVVGRWTLKTQLSPSPNERSPYFVTSFEKVPGTVFGHGLPDILEDVQEIANATLRGLVNNMGIASGPQVVVNLDCLAPTENADELYPWKRWKTVNDPMGDARPPITFFQPNSNAGELLQVYNWVNNLADDISAIPRYATGESLSGGAGRTASGLGMLMNNSSKVLQTVAANVDNDVIGPLLHSLYDMIMLTDTSGLLTGEEEIKVDGVTVSIQKETERQKQLQFLQITANPEDMQIVGMPGRARVLRAVAQDLGLGDDIVPDDDAIERQVQAQQAAAAQANAINNWLAMHGIKPGPATQGAQMELLSQPGPPEPGTQQPQQPPGAPGSQPTGARGGNAPRTTKPARHSDIAPPFNAFMQGRNQGVPTNVA